VSHVAGNIDLVSDRAALSHATFDIEIATDSNKHCKTLTFVTYLSNVLQHIQYTATHCNIAVSATRNTRNVTNP
jgi:hypothetical protein